MGPSDPGRICPVGRVWYMVYTCYALGATLGAHYKGLVSKGGRKALIEVEVQWGACRCALV